MRGLNTLIIASVSLIFQSIGYFAGFGTLLVFRKTRMVAGLRRASPSAALNKMLDY